MKLVDVPLVGNVNGCTFKIGDDARLLNTRVVKHNTVSDVQLTQRAAIDSGVERVISTQ